VRRSYYSASITDFLDTPAPEILGQLTRAHPFNLDTTQKGAWLEQITILKRVLTNRAGPNLFEYTIPRMGKRIEVVLIIGSALKGRKP